jgi:ABC-2 type transport system ATP-binding protein
MSSDLAVETVGIEKLYRARFGKEIRAVGNVSLQVPRGVKFGLLGANGAGKTTLVKMLLGIVHPTAGSARIFGREVQQPAARLSVGYLPENHRFPTYLSGAGMLDFYAALSGVESRQRRLRIPELLELVGLHDWGGVRLKKYSKGMLQRLGLAQALLHRPQLLVLDEPTDGVDPIGRREIREILNRLQDTGVTIFLNSHLLSEVEEFCDYVAILKRGELALQGKISHLLARGGYQLSLSNISEDVCNGVRELASLSSGESGFQAFASSREDANRVIDRVRAGGGFVEAMNPSTSTLEDLFIETTAPGTGK